MPSGGLVVAELAIGAAASEKLVMGAALDDLPVFDDMNGVGCLHRTFRRRRSVVRTTP